MKSRNAIGHRPGRGLRSAGLAIVVAIALALGATACGDDESSGPTDTQPAGTPTFVPETVETPATAVKTGHRLCKVLGGKKNLSKQFGTEDPVKIAKKFASDIYVGEYPQQAAEGCLEVVG